MVINWAVLSDEQMRKRLPFSLPNDEQMSSKVVVEHQPVNHLLSGMILQVKGLQFQEEIHLPIPLIFRGHLLLGGNSNIFGIFYPTWGRFPI